MFFERIKSEGLAHNSYIGSRGKRCTDPRRDCQVICRYRSAQGLEDKHIFEHTVMRTTSSVL